MTDHRFDFLENNEDVSFVVSNGLVPQTDDEKKLEYELFNSSVSMSTIWKEKDDTKKLILWDNHFEEYLEHRTALIGLAKQGAYFPFNIQKEYHINLVNGYGLNQGSVGTCAGAALRNALLASDLVNMKLCGYTRIVETGIDMVYSLARGSGRLAWGSGCNGTPLVKYTTEVGNYSTTDLGPYDVRGRNVTQSNLNNPQFRSNALKHQGICCYLPDVSFNTFYKVCAAGLGVWIGSPSFPSSATVQNGISVPARWSNGAHATCFQYGMEYQGTRYLYWQNSHGSRYQVSGDTFNTPPTGTWVPEQQFPNFRVQKEYGTPFVVLGELIKI